MGRLSAFCIQAKLGHPMQDVHLQGGELADRYSQRVRPSHPVISSDGSMLHKDAVKNRYSFEESRNLSCAREYQAFQNPSVACGASIGTPPPQAVPLPSKEGRLGCTATAKPRGLNVSPNSLSRDDDRRKETHR